MSSSAELVAGRQRRLYVITDAGRTVLALAKAKVWELFRELFEDELRFSTRGQIDERQAVELEGTSSPRMGAKTGSRRRKKTG